jgi:hypothetical protein
LGGTGEGPCIMRSVMFRSVTVRVLDPRAASIASVWVSAWRVAMTAMSAVASTTLDGSSVR